MNSSMHRALALAGCAALPLAALAQPADANRVSLYGFLKVDVEQVRASGTAGAAALRANRLSNNLSVLGFRAREDLGGGMAAWAQFEGNVRVDTGDGPFSGRNTAVGLSTPAGELVLGQWEAPLRFASVYAIDPFTAGIFASNSIMGNGFATAANGQSPASFDRRQPNLLQYWSPALGAWSLRLAYALPEEKTDQSSPDMFSGLLSYRDGPLYAAWGYELHRAYFGAHSRDDAHRLALAYTFGRTRLRGSWEQLRYEPAPGESLRRSAWQVAVTHQLDDWQELALSYVQAQAARGHASSAVGGIGVPGSDSGARQVSLGYTYRLSKRTDLWAAYTRITNGATAAYNLSANGIAGLKPGQDPSGLGIGITHRF
ncbi:putative porin [Acidovorax soli]|uniref:Putative porin n=1 Tax=Acidovorax soli TaxID=592050 RepID=A0A7X0UAH0_9BURK|nr:porin [Acidovorax soli]MBB6561226.1 putative porin [Acidovorax soli]